MVDLFEKVVKAEASVGAKVKVGTVFTWVRERCFSVKGGVETLINAGAKTLVELGMVLHLNAN